MATPGLQLLQTETACLILVSREPPVTVLLAPCSHHQPVTGKPHLLRWPIANISDDCHGGLSGQDLEGLKLGKIIRGQHEERVATYQSSRGQEASSCR